MCAESRVPWVPAVSRESRAVRDPLVPAAQLVQWDPGDRRACVETLVPRATQAASDFRVYEAIPVRWVQRGTGDQWVQRVIPVRKVPSVSEGNAEKKVNEITREERHQLVQAVKDFCITLVGLRDYKEAIITQGGVSVREVNPSTMESKKTAGLYFAGEVLDLDAVTGGFNLQIAWSTGYLAGISIPQ